MGLGASKNVADGAMLDKEFPRYQYQRIVWQEEGKTNTALALQVDAISQGLANASFLAFPVFIIASNSSEQFQPLELLGLIIWALAFAMETIADLQKVRFLRAMKKVGKQRQVCNIGLWKYCRHPNYFAEWMVWNGLVIAAIPCMAGPEGARNLMPCGCCWGWVCCWPPSLCTVLWSISLALYPQNITRRRKGLGIRIISSRLISFFPGTKKGPG